MNKSSHASPESGFPLWDVGGGLAWLLSLALLPGDVSCLQSLSKVSDPCSMGVMRRGRSKEEALSLPRGRGQQGELFFCFQTFTPPTLTPVSNHTEYGHKPCHKLSLDVTLFGGVLNLISSGPY